MTPRERELVRWFPGLRFPPASILAGPDGNYNCIGWAAGHTVNWWEPSGDHRNYWPPDCREGFTVEFYIEAFATQGYAVCDDGELQSGVEKVAIMATDGVVLHMMKQDGIGVWSSKLGRFERISHGLHDLVGDAYGRIHTFLSRPRQPPISVSE